MSKGSFKTAFSYIGCVVLFVAIVMGLTYKDKLVRWYKQSPRTMRVDDSYKRDAIKAYALHGIDVSHYQDRINWSALKHPDTSKTIHFAFIRATAGLRADQQFNRNWQGATQNNIVKGAYHYYHSDKNSALQASHFTSVVTLKAGDLPPVLDIEELPKKQSRERWREGLKNFLGLLEGHYGVKPIIYTGDSFFRDFLATDSYFKDYPHLWIANYNAVNEPRSTWHFWQFTDALPVTGMDKPVDGNVYNGTLADFEKLLVE